MIHYIIGLLIGTSPLGIFLYNAHHQPCGLEGEAWRECRQAAPSPGRRPEKPEPPHHEHVYDL